jgi:hypothetical protein
MIHVDVWSIYTLIGSLYINSTRGYKCDWSLAHLSGFYRPPSIDIPLLHSHTGMTQQYILVPILALGRLQLLTIMLNDMI